MPIDLEQTLTLVRALSEHQLQRDPNARRRVRCYLTPWPPEKPPLLKRATHSYEQEMRLPHTSLTTQESIRMKSVKRFGNNIVPVV